MFNLFRQEMRKLFSFLKNYFREIVVLCVSTLSLVLQWYRPIGSSLIITHLTYYVILPVLTILIILRKNPLDFGFRIGNIQLWSFYVAVTVVIGLPLLYLSSYFSSVGQYYSLRFSSYQFLVQTVPLLFAWEYLLRGFLLFGLKEKFKEASILIQMVPFVLMHLGKPEMETFSCIFTGLWFGYIAYRGKSFWPAFLIHVFINFSVKYFVNYQ
jgi:membrane protease YdiL (CAAX protease family)